MRDLKEIFRFLFKIPRMIGELNMPIEETDVLQDIRHIIHEWKEYKDLEEQGKLLKLPCAVGDTVYSLDRFCSGSSLDCPSRPCESCEDYQLEIYDEKFKLNDMNDFGKTVFLTREEAEAALDKMKNEQ